jgi:hypothetical protein
VAAVIDLRASWLVATRVSAQVFGGNKWQQDITLTHNPLRRQLWYRKEVFWCRRGNGALIKDTLLVVKSTLMSSMPVITLGAVSSSHLHHWQPATVSFHPSVLLQRIQC